MKVTAFCIYLLSVLTGTAMSAVYYVHPDSTQSNIQACLDMCSENDTVLVGPGTYVENIVWPNTEAIKLLSEHGPDSTTIDGDSAGSVIRMSVSDTNTVVSGFTIRNGWTTGSGGGVYVYGALVFIGNVVTGNTAQYGGGIYSGPALGPRLHLNRVAGNRAGGTGGGIWLASIGGDLYGNEVSDNQAGMQGGGIALMDMFGNFGSIDSCLFTGNTAPCGGGMYFEWDAQHIVTRSRIAGNASDSGAGIACDPNACFPRFEDCDIRDNAGDGVFCRRWSAPSFARCIIDGNEGYGIRNVDSDTFADADSCWWGHSSGPYHRTLNPGGQGDSVSDYVHFTPWDTLPPVGCAEPPGVPTLARHPGAIIVSGELYAPSRKSAMLLDITGRRVMDLELGLYDIRHVVPGVYFVQTKEEPTVVRRVLVTR